MCLVRDSHFCLCVTKILTAIRISSKSVLEYCKTNKKKHNSFGKAQYKGKVPSVNIITFLDGAIKESTDTLQKEERFPNQVLVYT